MHPAPVFESPRISFIRRGLARITGRLAIALTAAPLAARVLLGGFGLLTHAATAGLDAALALGALSSLVLGFLSVVLQFNVVGVAGALTCSDRGLTVKRLARTVIPPEAIAGGVVIPEKHGARVEIETKAGTVVTALLPSVEQADAVLRALQLDASKQRTRIQLADPAARLVTAGAVVGATVYAATFALPLLMLVARGAFAWFSLVALVSYVVVRATALPEVTIGADGLAFKRGLRETFVPFAELADVRPAGLGILLVYRDGRTLKVTSLAGIAPARFEALRLRIGAALAAARAGEAAALAQLNRNGKSVADWRTALASAVRAGSGYRAATLGVEDLEGVVDSADAPLERRIGAAIALKAAGGPRAAERIRIAAERSASSRVRVVLHDIGQGVAEDDAIAEALAEEEAAAARATGRVG